MTFKLQFYFFNFWINQGFPEVNFWGFFRLMLILHFEAIGDLKKTPFGGKLIIFFFFVFLELN